MNLNQSVKVSFSLGGGGGFNKKILKMQFRFFFLSNVQTAEFLFTFLKNDSTSDKTFASND